MSYENEINFWSGLNRRRFLQGMVAAGLATWGRVRATAALLTHEPSELRGTEFDLTIDRLPVNFTGKPRTAVAVNGSVPGPTLRWKEGDTVRISVTNRLKTFTSIHWHGMRIPSEMDGVPGLSYAGIAPGEKFTYQFQVKQNGTYWYHSHSGFQEQTGLSGAIIIEPKYSDPEEFDREFTILLADWTDVDPHTILSNLKQDSDYYNHYRPSLEQFSADAKKQGFSAALSKHMMWAKMNMSPADIADVSGAVYTYLMNGTPPAAGWTGLFSHGQKIKLRFINGSAMTFFDVRIPGLHMKVVAADGNAIEPVTVDEFRIGTAETYDVIIAPDNMAYTIFAQAEDRTGFARGTLTPNPGMTAETPPMDPPPVRSMTDMGMNMKMKMKGMGPDGKMDMGTMPGMNMASANSMADMDMSKTDSVPNKSTGTSGIEIHSDSAMNISFETTPTTPNLDARSPLPQPSSNAPILGAADPMRAIAPKLISTPLKIGPEVTQIAASASPRLHDPGDGLQNNGRRVLTYADLRARYRGVDRRPPTREIELQLTGNMERFIWGFDGKKFSQAHPITLQLGERVRIVLINDSMMEHPIHLHGLWSELENGNGEFNPYKHTVVVKPSERISYLVTADAPGHWAYHCHLMFHMEAGMFRTVVVA